MDLTAFRSAIDDALKSGEAPEFPEEELPWQALLEVSAKAEEATVIAMTALHGAENVREPQLLARGLDAFREWVGGWLTDRIRELLCRYAYEEINTVPEREKIAEDIVDLILTELAGKIPGGSIGKLLAKPIVEFFVAMALAEAAKAMAEYCRNVPVAPVE